MDTWSDDRFDYFLTSDGKVARVRRDVVRERAEAEAAEMRRRVMGWNRAVRIGVTLFVTSASLWLVVLILMALVGGAV